MENSFNLLDEAWIPVADAGKVSLLQIFKNSQYRSLGGNPVQKIALMKLLLAIAQAANTPKDEQEWRALGAQGLAENCINYLEKWRERFYLYGERPFLQMPSVEGLICARTQKRVKDAKSASKILEAIGSGAPKDIGTGLYPDLPSENNTLLSHTLFSQKMNSAEKAIFLVTLMNFSFAGKRTETGLVSLGGSLLGNHYSASAGPSLGGWQGQLHCFTLTGSILDDVWINLLTRDGIGKLNRWPEGLGKALWEEMPSTESDELAITYKQTYQACLLSLSRFVLLNEDGILYLDGIKYPSIKNGWYEPSLVLSYADKDVKVKYVDPERRPWRELQALLSFLGDGSSIDFECFFLRLGVERLRDVKEYFSVWSGGLKVTSNSGDQSVKQRDDFVESVVWLESKTLGENWFSQLKIEMSSLDAIAKFLYGCVLNFYKEQKVDGTKLAAQATHLFWQFCERNFQELVNNCDATDDCKSVRHELRRRFAAYAHQSYDQLCPKETARQLDAWAKCRPNTNKYLSEEM